MFHINEEASSIHFTLGISAGFKMNTPIGDILGRL